MSLVRAYGGPRSGGGGWDLVSWFPSSLLLDLGSGGRPQQLPILSHLFLSPAFSPPLFPRLSRLPLCWLDTARVDWNALQWDFTFAPYFSHPSRVQRETNQIVTIRVILTLISPHTIVSAHYLSSLLQSSGSTKINYKRQVQYKINSGCPQCTIIIQIQ